MKIKLTKKEQRLLDYDSVISKNRAKFKAGSRISRKEFIALFGITGVGTGNRSTGSYKKLHKENLKLISAQQDINTLLRANGITMKSKDYYSEFYVCHKEQTKNEIVRYASQVDCFSYCENQLEAGIKERTTAGTWGTYKKVFRSKAQVKVKTSAQTYSNKSRAITRVKTI